MCLKRDVRETAIVGSRYKVNNSQFIDVRTFLHYFSHFMRIMHPPTTVAPLNIFTTASAKSNHAPGSLSAPQHLTIRLL